MRKVAYLEPSKETENKLRWSTLIRGVPFHLYVPKDRVPKPWPGRISVTITNNILAPQGMEGSVTTKENLENPILCVVEKTAEQTETARYCPIGDPSTWELGEPYIPYSLFPDGMPDQVLIEVQWDRRAKTWGEYTGLKWT